MIGRAARKLDFSRDAAATATIAVMLVFGVLNAPQSQAQSQTADAVSTPPLAFEVASIRPDDPGGMFNMVRATFTPDSYSAEHVSLQMLIKNAYGVDNNQISGAPKWIGSERYEVEARIDSNTAYALSKLSGDQLKLAHQRMLQALLADRFKLTLHSETRDLPVYLLVIGKGGPKIHEAKPGDTYTNGIKNSSGDAIGPHMGMMRLGGGRLAAQGLPMESLVNGLTGQLGRKVLDKTGLTGNYDYILEWTPDTGHAEGTEEPSGPSIFVAIQEQLGLKLESQIAPVEILVIDHAETPSSN
jgi:uncharacterized protein (TIGR03435 family)